MYYKLIYNDKEYTGTPISLIKEISSLGEIEGSLYCNEDLLITGNKYALLNELKLEEFINLTNVMRNRIDNLNKKIFKNNKTINQINKVIKGLLLSFISLLCIKLLFNLGIQINIFLFLTGLFTPIYSFISYKNIKKCKEDNKKLESNINRIESNMMDVEIKINELEDKKINYIEKTEELEDFFELIEKVKVKKLVK